MVKRDALPDMAHEFDDDLSTARGIIIGIALGVGVWTVISLAILIYVRLG